jgi:hypothetical protein
MLPESFFQYLNFQVRPMQFAFQMHNAELGIGRAHGEVLS